VLKRRVAKEKRKLSHKLFVQDLLLIEEELKEIKTVDAALSKARIDYKNLTTQMFAERFNLSNINNNRGTGGSRFS
jgi:tRNA isopentenyl-2-thiomethyl-A-37 hydroxylase MiaE